MEDAKNYAMKIADKIFYSAKEITAIESCLIARFLMEERKNDLYLMDNRFREKQTIFFDEVIRHLKETAIRHAKIIQNLSIEITKK